MPLIKSSKKSAIGENINREESAGKPRRQAVAIALDIQRRAKREHMAAGGTPFYIRSEAHEMARPGMIHSFVPGRTDKIAMGVHGGSYVLPADIVSSIGEGNSLAGAHALNRLFSSGPYGSAMPHIAAPHVAAPKLMAAPKPPRFAKGGTTPIIAAGGEYLVDPETVQRIGGGDMKRGHDTLDAFVKHIRSKTIKTLKKLPGPKKN
jgi:hypothetical protein